MEEMVIQKIRQTANRQLFFVKCLLLSVLIHSFFFLWAWWTLPSSSPPEKSLVFVDFLNSHQQRQIVDQTDFNQLIPKQKTPYLSRKNQAIEKQTQAMMEGLFHQQSTSSMSSHSPSSHLTPKKKVNRQISSVLPDRFKKELSQPLQLDLSGVSTHQLSKNAISNATSNLDESSDWSRTTDFLPGIELGSHTLLSTKEFLYYSYFSRMKEQLYLRWVQYFRKDPHLLLFKLSQGFTHQLFSTHLYALLSPSGELEDLQVIKSCGQEDIDSAALHAFMASAPFPNPPKQLILKDGYVHIRQSFHLYIRNLLSSLN